MIAFRRTEPRALRRVVKRHEPTGVGALSVSTAIGLCVLVVAVLSSALIDLPRQWGQWRGVTALGAVTVSVTALCTMALAAIRPFPLRPFRTLAPYAGLLLWALCSTAWAPPQRGGYQTGAVLVAFLAVALLAAGVMHAARDHTDRVLQWSMRAADVIGLGLVTASMALRGWPTNIDEVPWFVHPRAIALFGLVPLSWHLARWVRGNERSALASLLWVVAIFVSLSRTATATAVILLLLAAVARAQNGRLSSMRRAHQVALLLVPLIMLAVVTVTPFRARFVATNRRGVETGEYELRDNGRTRMWESVAQSAAEAPILGKGLGSSESVVSEGYKWVGHPHNDYLRLWHDLGAPGLLLFLWTLGAIGRFCWRHISQAVYLREVPPQYPLATAGVLIALLAGMTTDNSVVYSFVMIPTAVVIGAGLGSERRRRRSRRTSSTPSSADVERPHGAASQPADLAPPQLRRRRRKRRHD